MSDTKSRYQAMLDGMTTTELEVYVEFGKNFLIEHPEPPILKGKSQVRKWVEIAEAELQKRGEKNV